MFYFPVHSVCELSEQDSLDFHSSHINRKLVQKSSKMGRGERPKLKSSRTLINLLTSKGSDLLLHHTESL